MNGIKLIDDEKREAEIHFNELYGYTEQDKLEHQNGLIKVAREDAFIEGMKYQKEKDNAMYVLLDHLYSNRCHMETLNKYWPEVGIILYGR